MMFYVLCIVAIAGLFGCTHWGVCHPTRGYTEADVLAVLTPGRWKSYQELGREVVARKRANSLHPERVGPPLNGVLYNHLRSLHAKGLVEVRYGEGGTRTSSYRLASSGGSRRRRIGWRMICSTV